MILNCDVMEGLARIDDDSIHCCVTSPPYWGLRDYGVEGQMGLEKTPEEYVARMVAVFREVRRVLRDDGTLWLNLGDSYATTPTGNRGSKSTLNGADSAAYRETLDRYTDAKTKRAPIPKGLKPKDLVGIPWRVAFALQAPYEHHLIPNIADRAWLAAMIDGEGCITIPECKSSHESGSSFPPIIQIRMCDTQCLEKCIALTGKGGKLNEQLPPSYEEANQRPAYQWRINGTTVSSVLADIYPFMLIKRKQACVAWTLQKIRDSYETKRGVPIPDVALMKQQECRRLIGKLNQREVVDLPSWIEEPRFIVEPGWYLRQDLIWAKPNPMPESVTDRCTKAHEYIFLLSKSERYYYDMNAIREPWTSNRDDMRTKGIRTGLAYLGGAFNNSIPDAEFGDGNRVNGDAPHGRNRRSVWTVTTQHYREAHFATFPPKLIEPCIKAGCPMGGTVLDPFAGSGTTGQVAMELGRNFILIELNPNYIKLINNRLSRITARFPGI